MRIRLLLTGLPILALAVDDRVEIENAQVRVRRVTTPSRAKSDLQEYRLNRVIVFLDGGSETLTRRDGRKQRLSWRAGDAKWLPAGSYTRQNATDQPFRAVEVEIKSPPSGKPTLWPSRDPVKNDSPLHEHIVNRVSVFLTDAYIEIADADGTVSESRPTAGTAAWGGPTIHTERNLMDKLFEVILVEIKP
jgi:hypothetical protein